MERRLAILDYLKQPTGRFTKEPVSELSWNDFVGYVQCSVFDASGRLLLLKKETESGDVVYEGIGSYLYESSDSKETVSGLLSFLLGAAFSEHSLTFLRSLTRRNTIIDLFEYILTDGTPEILALPDSVTEYRFVTEEEFRALRETGTVRESMHSAFHYREMVSMHYKNIYRTGWPRVTDREYAWEYVKDNVLCGIISLMHLKNVRERNVKTMIGRDYVITDNDYYWFQYAPKNEHFWLTVMFDPDLNIVQYYIDISYRNEVFWDGNAYFFDLYLDIVLLPDGTQLLLDEDELTEALNSGKISREMYDMAWDECRKLQALLSGREPELHKLVTDLTKHLKKRMERK